MRALERAEETLGIILFAGVCLLESDANLGQKVQFVDRALDRSVLWKALYHVDHLLFERH